MLRPCKLDRRDFTRYVSVKQGLTRIDPSHFWEVREARNGVRLIKELATNGRRQRQDFFSYREVQKWNLLPVEVKTAPSLAAFSIDEILMREN